MSDPQSPEAMVSHPAPERDRVSAARLFLALALTPSAWLLQLLGSYFFASNGCDPLDAAPPAVVPGLWIVVLLLNLACIAAGATGFALAYGSWNRSRHEKKGGKHFLLDVGEGRTRFTALSAVIVSGIFLAAIVAEAAALLIIGRCSPGTWS